MFTEEQERIINYDEGAILVQAGPGSGKTAVLTQRIIRLLKSTAGQTFRVLALTFTTKAAENMRQRIEETIGEEWRRTTISTFHAFCLDVLRHYGDHIDVRQPVSVYEQEEDRLALLAKGLMQEGLAVNGNRPDDRQLANILFQISLRKRDLILPEAVAPVSAEATYFKAAYAGYNRQLELHHGVDFDDLLLLTYRLFAEAPRVVRHYRRMYRYILIDEAQDTSRAQYEVLKLLCGDEHRNVMVVADADQSIYHFAGASERYLELFLKDFHATLLPLSQNFRSAPGIVATANRLIQHNNRLHGAPAMQAQKVSEESFVLLHEEETEEQEAQWVAEQTILLEDRLRNEHPTKFGKEEPQFQSIAVLARNRYLLEPVRAAFETKTIPYHFLTANEGLFATPQARILHLILRVWHNPYDLIHREVLLAELGLTNRDFTASLDELNGKSAETFFDLVVEKDDMLLCWKNFLRFFLNENKNTQDISCYFSNMINAFEKQIFPCEQDAGHDELLQRDLKLLKTSFEKFAYKHPIDERDLERYLHELALSSKSASGNSGVQLLTLHAAKGLEFDAVILIGMNQGSFPDYRSLRTPNGLEEERRNAYVAVTRAKRFLCLTRCRRRLMPWGDIKLQEPSQFLREMELKNR